MTAVYDLFRVREVLPPTLQLRLLNREAVPEEWENPSGRDTVRLSFVANVIRNLRGTYDNDGITRWFDRPRMELGGRTPAMILSDDWDLDDDGVLTVQRLAQSLSGSRHTPQI